MKKISGRYQIGIIFLFKFWSIQAQGLNDTGKGKRLLNFDQMLNLA